MSKTYLLLIGGLVVLALLVGGYAYMRSKNNQPIIPNVVNPIQYPNIPAGSSGSGINSAKNQIALTVLMPTNGAQLTTPSTQIKGRTVPNADVSVNDQDVKADAQGNFTATVDLEEGTNYIDITATDDSGKVAETELILVYTPTQ